MNAFHDLIAPSNRLPDLVPLIPDVRNALDAIAAGEVIEIRVL
jgi:hypothetical protein